MEYHSSAIRRFLELAAMYTLTYMCDTDTPHWLESWVGERRMMGVGLAARNEKFSRMSHSPFPSFRGL